jgi:hypothetical protein
LSKSDLAADETIRLPNVRGDTQYDNSRLEYSVFKLGGKIRRNVDVARIAPSPATNLA